MKTPANANIFAERVDQDEAATTRSPRGLACGDLFDGRAQLYFGVLLGAVGALASAR